MGTLTYQHAECYTAELTLLMAQIEGNTLLYEALQVQFGQLSSIIYDKQIVHKATRGSFYLPLMSFNSVLDIIQSKGSCL